LTHAAGAEVLEIDQLKISALTRGRLVGFSLDRLGRFLVPLGSDVGDRRQTACARRRMCPRNGPLRRCDNGRGLLRF
jgi:hypothetical protein